MTKLLGRVGIAVSLALWMASLPVLAMTFRGIEAVPSRVAAGLWGLLFVGLQLAGPLLMAFTLRAAHRWRTAVCFTFGVGCGMLLDALGLVGLLVWLRF